jgi:hypothetical protein
MKGKKPNQQFVKTRFPKLFIDENLIAEGLKMEIRQGRIPISKYYKYMRRCLDDSTFMYRLFNSFHPETQVWLYTEFMKRKEVWPAPNDLPTNGIEIGRIVETS